MSELASTASVALDTIHTVAISAWFGCMVYSVSLVQRHPAAERDPRYYEDFVSELANGTRWIILGLLGAIIPTWVATVLIRMSDGPGPGVLWFSLVVVKSLFLVSAVSSFSYLSWHVWPLRIFALPEELPGVRRRFLRISFIVMVSLGAALAIGVVVRSL